MSSPPLVVHINYRLSMGGLENGLVNLINTMPKDAYRHAIVCLKPGNDFTHRLPADVAVYCLDKQDGQDWPSFLRFYRLLKQLKPAIVHSRNLATIEYQLSAWAAGVKQRVHGEHGWDVYDPDGSNKKYQWLRRGLKLFVKRFIPLSKHLESYLLDKIHVPPAKITRIINGVDTAHFYPRAGQRLAIADCPLTLASDDFVIGTIGRMHGVKDQLTLVNAFIHLHQQADPKLQQRLKLIIIGDGPLREPALALLAQHGLQAQAWLPGQRTDTSELLRLLDLFVLPSQAEGISNTILEAMATGLPVVATDVGGNPELVAHGETGLLTPVGDVPSMAAKLMAYACDAAQLQQHGANARQRVLAEFSLTAMAAHYQSVYDSLLNKE